MGSRPTRCMCNLPIANQKTKLNLVLRFSRLGFHIEVVAEFYLMPFLLMINNLSTEVKIN